MLTWEEDIDAHALQRRGWTISAIARHLDRDRKTIRYAAHGIGMLCRPGRYAAAPAARPVPALSRSARAA
jgi:hypothetical protein